MLGNRFGWWKECAPSDPVFTSSKLPFSSISETVGIPQLPSYYCCWTSPASLSLLILCELEEEEMLVILCMVTPVSRGLGLLCSCTSHLTLLFPCLHSNLCPTTLQGRPPALGAGLSSGPYGLDLSILECPHAGLMKLAQSC